MCYVTKSKNALVGVFWTNLVFLATTARPWLGSSGDHWLLTTQQQQQQAQKQQHCATECQQQQNQQLGEWVSKVVIEAKREGDGGPQPWQWRYVGLSESNIAFGRL